LQKAYGRVCSEAIMIGEVDAKYFEENACLIYAYLLVSVGANRAAYENWLLNENSEISLSEKISLLGKVYLVAEKQFTVSANKEANAVVYVRDKYHLVYIMSLELCHRSLL